ncbi:helix-turn-helix domain-containing protein [Candidatus Woesearchaeota archaeon]|nr:helix-turn-helix domain-containing protein [Candidatus Woesearchaeota archaeon]
MINKDNLMQIGLTKNETDVYLCLLQLEEALAGEVSKKTGISRTYIYDTIERLAQKGLVSYVVRNGKRYYRAASPNKVIDYLKEQEAKVNLILPELLALHKPLIKKPVVEVYDGPEGMKNIYTIMFRTKPKEWLLLGSSGKAEEVVSHDFLNIMESKRAKLGIGFKCLMNPVPQAIKRGKELVKFQLTEVRYLPQTYVSPVSIYLFGDYTSLMLWMKEKPLAILIHDKDITRSFKEHFKILWELSKVDKK